MQDVGERGIPWGRPPISGFDGVTMGRAESPMNTEVTTLYRPVGADELRLIEVSGWTAFPPRLKGQPIFYPVLNREYAVQIARDWNVKETGSGYVTAFDVDSAFVSRYEVKVVGARQHEELWVPAEELAEFNAHIIGPIRVTDRFETDPSSGS